jgi:protein ATS1
MPKLMACGSNSTGLLSLNHPNDVSTFQEVSFHPSLDDVLGVNYRILDLASSSAHSLLLVAIETGDHLLLGAGLNTLGQLGSRCALWDDVRVEGRFKVVNLLGDLGFSHEEWKPVKIGVTWTTSFVVYERVSSSRIQCRCADMLSYFTGTAESSRFCG